MERISDLIIIGAGPAGMTAAIYASRAGLSTIMLESGVPGGKLTKTNEISNWTGIKNINGFDLANQFFAHSTEFGAEYVYGNVDEVKINGDIKEVHCDDGITYKAKAVIVATGTKERLLGIPGEEVNIGRGVSYCAVCDGAFFRDKEVAVIGGGNSALEEALYITQFASKVHIIMRRDVFRADEIVINEVMKNEKIHLVQNSVPLEILDDEQKVTGLKLKNLKDESESLLEVSGIFPYIGAIPITQFLSNMDVLDKQGYMLVDENMETSVKGIYGAGDVNQKVLRQVVTAAADGAIAAQSAFHRVKGI